MHSGFDAVVHFQVKLWELVFRVRTGFLDISQRRGIHDVTDNEALDRLILGDGFSSRDASDTLNVTAALLITSVVASLYSHSESVERGSNIST